MAIKISDYKQTKHKGLKQSKKNSSTYLLDFRIRGSRHRKHVDAENLDVAYQELQKYKADIEKQYTIEADLDATIDDYFKIVLNVKNWSAKVKGDYENYYKNHMKKFLGHLVIKDVKSNVFTKFNQKCIGMSTRTHKKAYEILRPIFDLAIEDELITASPIKKSHIPVRRSQEEKRHIQDAITKYGKVHKAIIEKFESRDDIRAFFLFGFHGRRIKEVQRLKWKDIDFRNSKYVIRRENSKVNQDMSFTLPNEIHDILLEMSNGTNQNDDIFPVKDVHKHYDKIREYTKIPEYSFHWMRNLLVSAMFEKGATVEDLSSTIGHTDAATLKKYLTMNRATSTERTNDLSTAILSEIATDNFFNEVAEKNRID